MTIRSLTMRQILFVLLLLFPICSSADTNEGERQNESSKSRPNFLVIVSDDQRYDSLMPFMPLTNEKVFTAGATFNRAYVTTPQCCPSRSSIFTGMYARRHGVMSNRTPLQGETTAIALHKSGYYTGLVGKYLNSSDGAPRSEYDWWVSFSGGSVQYMNPKLNVNGDWKKHKGYVTKILGYYADEFLMSAAKQEKPFLLYLTPNTPHEPAIPAPGSERYFRDMPPHRPPNYLEEDQSDKPDWLKNRKRLDQEHIDAVDQFRIRQFQSLRTFDGVVGSLIDKLQELSLLENTMVFYISDNGVMWGEHGLTSKNCIYEAAIHVPFAVTAPFLTKKPQVFDELVANIDIAPTIYELSGVTPPAGVNGKSLVPLLKGGKGGHHRLLIEDWRDSKIRRPFDAVHTGRFVYVENKGDKDELYDLETDPYQLNNQIDSPGHAKRVADLKKDLAKLKIEAAPLNAGRN